LWLQGACEQFNKYTTELRENALTDVTTSKQLIDLLMDCDFLQLIQKLWRQYMSPELLQQSTCSELLPEHIANSLSVCMAVFSTPYCR